jgi:two-component system capsular synthesis sensor histidine kinase RcsC
LLTKPASLLQMQEILTRLVRTTPAPAVPAVQAAPVDPFERVVREAFRQSWPVEKDKLQQAIDNGEHDRVLRILHRLQGGLQAMGLDELAARSVELQHAIAAAEGTALAACRNGCRPWSRPAESRQGFAVPPRAAGPRHLRPIQKVCRTPVTTPS